MTEQNIKDLLHKGERVTLECKRATKAVPNSVWETYSALANTYGGVILLGVNEDLQERDPAKRFTITGVEDADKMRKDLWNMLNNPEKVSVNLLKDEDIDELSIDGKTMVYIRVPRAAAELRPVYVNGNQLRGCFKRNHEGDYHAGKDLVGMMLRDANPDGNDGLRLEHYTMDDIDIPTLERYRMVFHVNNPNHPWDDLDHTNFLIQLGGCVKDRATAKAQLTMAGLLMFGKGLPVRERFDNLRMDYIDMSNLIGDQRYSDRLTYDGRWENNLYNFMSMVLPKLTFVLPRPFQMEGVVRKDDTIQHKAVREAFTNMIIHADMMLNGLIRVKKFDDHFELTNPGLLKLPVEQIYRGGESKARNQRMQNMLRMVGFGENIGSGFPLILKAWEEKHWVRPEIVEQPELQQTTLRLWMNKTDSGMENVVKDVVKETTDKEDSKEHGSQPDVVKDGANVVKDVVKTLPERQKEILKLMITQPGITAEQISAYFTVTPRTVQRDIQTLQQLGLVVRQGSRSEGQWQVLMYENRNHK